MTESIHLTGLGRVRALPLSAVRPGQTIVWNHGSSTEVISIEPTTATSCKLTVRGKDGREYTQRKRLTTLVAAY